MILSFTLTMPNRGSWNGQWSGQNNLYAVCRSLPKSLKSKAKAERLSGHNFYYRWNDGWGANVAVAIVDSKTARNIQRSSQGFYGYDWMIDSILAHGKIYASHEDIPKEEAATA